MSADLESQYDQWTNESPYASELVWLSQEKKGVQLMVNDEEFYVLTKDGSYSLQAQSKGLGSWVSEVNEDISKRKLSFGDFLTAAMKHYHEMKDKATRKSEKERASSDEDNNETEEQGEGEAEEDEDEEDEDEEEYVEEGATDEFDIESDEFKASLEILRKRKRWAAKTEELRENQEAKDSRKGNVENIFSRHSAVGVLTNDLLNIMQNSEELGYSATPIQDNIYHWNVKLFSFSPESTIAKHLWEVKGLYGYDYIELEISFVTELYPFYPPTVKVVRPRLSGFLMGRITSMEILKLSYWDPVKDMRYVLAQIKRLLQEWGKIDVNNPLNELSKQAYRPLEYQLLRLAIVSETDPRANLKYNLETELRETNRPTHKVEEKDEKDAQKKGTYWAKGTGYGSGATHKVDWDVNAYLAAQKQKDKDIQAILEDILRELESPELLSFDVLEESCLVPVLESFLRNDSLLDIERHSSVYVVVLAVVRAIAEKEYLLPLIDTLPNQSKSVEQLMQQLNTQSSIFMNRVKKNSIALKDSEASMINVTIMETYDLVNKKIAKYNANMRQLEGEINNRLSLSAQNNSDETEEERNRREEKEYLSTMKPLQFDMMQIAMRKHFYRSEINSSSGNLKEKIIRLGHETGSLATSLPLSFSSSVYVRVDEENMDFMQALITGPVETPYSGGCFLFDIYFPPTYPQVPPKVNLMTTGEGKVRFNPNLYDSGKVCLSLLGTWQGNVGESWNKDTSTLLQVLVSIQSLILVPMPFFNEPGFEAHIGTPKGDENNRLYNENIQKATIEHAIIGQLQSPPTGFEDVIKTHFKLKQHAILRETEKWLTEGIQSKGHYAKLLKLVKQMKEEFARL